MENLGGIEQKIGYAFSDITLLARALTHSSYANERNQRTGARAGGAGRAGRAGGADAYVMHNEMLEFLGDAILGFVVAEELYKKLPGENEGSLSQKRASVICEASLARCAGELGLSGFLQIGNTMIGEKNGGQKAVLSNAILSDAVEAIFAAVYLDGGFEAARGVVQRCLGKAIDASLTMEEIDNYKSRLQELFSATDKNVRIEYTVTNESGPPHKRRFTSQVAVNGRVLGAGKGGTKKESEQNAARQALNRV